MTPERRSLLEPAFVQGLLPLTVRVTTLLGQGGQGVVFSGSVDGEPAAVKIYFPGQVEARIDREVSLLRKLTSAHLARVLWTGDAILADRTLRVVASELVRGGSLDVRLKDGPMASERVESLLYGVCGAVDLLWQHRVVHRDLKPGNLLEREDGSWCVIDLGLARHLDEASLTVQGGTWGTVGYLSPEQSRCVRGLTCKSDIFTAGVVAVESLLGKHPTEGDQRRLLADDFTSSLPAIVAGWRFGTELQRMLHPQAFRRPSPRQIMARLAALNTKLIP